MAITVGRNRGRKTSSSRMIAAMGTWNAQKSPHACALKRFEDLICLKLSNREYIPSSQSSNYTRVPVYKSSDKQREFPSLVRWERTGSGFEDLSSGAAGSDQGLERVWPLGHWPPKTRCSIVEERKR